MKRPRAGRLQRRAILKIEKPLTSKECWWWEQFFLLSDQSRQKPASRCVADREHTTEIQMFEAEDTPSDTALRFIIFYHLCCKILLVQNYKDVLWRVDENSKLKISAVRWSRLSWNEGLHFWMCRAYKRFRYLYFNTFLITYQFWAVWPVFNLGQELGDQGGSDDPRHHTGYSKETLHFYDASRINQWHQRQ